MRTWKALLLCAAAALFGVSAGHAGELQGKAKSADRAKMCSSYGPGFRRVPGSDVCVKIGGWARAEAVARSTGGSIWDAPTGGGHSGGHTSLAVPSRGYITTDVRAKTEYGPVRAYMSVGVNHQ